MKVKQVAFVRTAAVLIVAPWMLSANAQTPAASPAPAVKAVPQASKPVLALDPSVKAAAPKAVAPGTQAPAGAAKPKAPAVPAAGAHK